MRLSLIICTFMRPHSLECLLTSVENQIVKPDEVIIVDGSLNDETKDLINLSSFTFNLKYYLVSQADRGLTLQRNYGISKVDPNSDLISFLDDDLILLEDYFQQIKLTFEQNSSAIGVGGIDLIENSYFKKKPSVNYSSFNYFEIDGWVSKEPLRYKLRKLFGLMSSNKPGIVPSYGHGRTELPPNGNIYRVEHFMGGIATYKRSLFNHISFSSYFQGYGLYEDFDFCIRALKIGDLFVNTSAQVKHYHEPSGRPNYFKYGKMVVRNGYYILNLRFPKNTFINKLKWHLITLLLAHLRLVNSISGPNRRIAFNDYAGRMIGWVSLFFNSPK
ncbi:MAG: glycosyltransferase [Algoriphagus sp.]|uniref:glycosyltransferase family 2 protein n=1 Tax=Algoriphagus sp. TaxID=1872435 RepID=UPI0017910989|nr:glycosyltransferase [Algoriphagus sp.]NVJ86768.1 glycosyltransferase [Algoriphagus sp.]